MTLNEFLAEAGSIVGFAKKAEAETESAAAKLKASEDKANNLQTELNNSNAQKDAANGRVKELEGQLAAANTRADKAEADLKKLTEDPSGTVQKLASQKALEITAGQGQTPPVAATPPQNPAAPAKTETGLKGFARVSASFQAQAEKILGRKS